MTLLIQSYLCIPLSHIVRDIWLLHHNCIMSLGSCTHQPICNRLQTNLDTTLGSVSLALHVCLQGLLPQSSKHTCQEKGNPAWENFLNSVLGSIGLALHIGLEELLPGQKGSNILAARERERESAT